MGLGHPSVASAVGVGQALAYLGKGGMDYQCPA